MTAAVSLASTVPAFVARHGDRRFRIRPVALVPDWRMYRVPLPERTKTISPEELSAIERAARAVGHPGGDDLKQFLAERLLTHRPVRNLTAWLKTCARNWLRDEQRTPAHHRALDEERHALGTARGYRKGPSWYPPHPDAREFAPFACKGARLMTYKRPEDVEEYEEVLVRNIDLRNALGLSAEPTPTCAQDAIAIQAIRDKRTSAHNSNDQGKKPIAGEKFARLLSRTPNMNQKPSTDSIRSGALPETLRGRLVRARETYGMKRVLAATLTAEGTHWRAEAGGNVYHGTVLAIERGLELLEREAP